MYLRDMIDNERTFLQFTVMKEKIIETCYPKQSLIHSPEQSQVSRTKLGSIKNKI